MNLLEARVALRPRSVSDLIDLAGPFCVAGARLLLPLALLVAAVGGGIALHCRVGLRWAWSSVWWMLAGYLVIASGLFTVAAGELLFARPEDIRFLAILARFAKRLPHFFLAKLLQIILLGLCLGFVPIMPVVASRLRFVSEAVLLEKASPLASILRSSRLVLYRSLPCLGIVLACLGAPCVFAVAADLAGDTVVRLILEMGQPFGSLWSDGGSAYAVAGALLAAPFVASASFLGYIDLRTRKEGWDIQLRFMAQVGSAGNAEAGSS